MTQQFQEVLQLVISAATLIGMIIMAYRFMREPDVKAETDIGLLKQGCEFKHSRLDTLLDQLSGNMRLIQENDLKHIEKEMGGIKESMVKIFTILEERLSKNKD
jgi:hypothetical protein